jgi:atypical dual specificity phosphatase
MIWSMSNWFRAYGFADVDDDLLVGAYPLDGEDIRMLTQMHVERVLNLVEDEEYEPHERERIVALYAAAGIEEERMRLVDFGRIPPDLLEAAVQKVRGWLDDGQRVYVHCRAGWQRSPAVAAGVVAVRDGIGIEQALEQVHRRKPSAEPLPHQREDVLRWWEERG